MRNKKSKSNQQWNYDNISLWKIRPADTGRQYVKNGGGAVIRSFILAFVVFVFCILTTAEAHLPISFNTFDDQNFLHSDMGTDDLGEYYKTAESSGIPEILIKPEWPPSVWQEDIKRPEEVYLGDELNLGPVLGPEELYSAVDEVEYQWYRDGKPLEGATGKSLIINGVTKDDLGSYFVMAYTDADTLLAQSRRVLVWRSDPPVFRYEVPGKPAENYQSLQDKILESVSEHADNVLELGRDRWSGKDTPLFADGLNLATWEPAIWRHNGNEYYISNFASQQNLMRTLVALSRLAGDEQYKQAAMDATAYMFDHHQYESGLLPWGGHRFLDLKTLDDVYGFDSNSHELKRHFPYYDLMFDVDKESATQLVRGFWESHIYDWSNEFYHNRHGRWVDRVPEDIWDRPFSDPDAHQMIDRGTMVHTSNDLMYAAAHSFRHNPEQEQGALQWAERKGGLWYKARNPKVGLGSYHYHLGHNPNSGWGSHMPPPQNVPGRVDAPYEWSDLFERLGEDPASYGTGAASAVGSTRFWATTGWPGVIYADATIAQLRMAELLGEEHGTNFMYWAHTALRAFAESDAYNPETNTINRMLTNGRVLEPDFTTAGLRFFYTFSIGYRMTQDEALWPVARGVARAHELGEIGPSPGVAVKLNLTTSNAEPEAMLSFLELYQALEEPAYLEMAVKIAENILEQKFHKKHRFQSGAYGFFVRSKEHTHVCFDDPEPFALLSLVAVLRGEPDLLPLYANGRSYIHGRYDGEGRTYDHRVIWSQTK